MDTVESLREANARLRADLAEANDRIRSLTETIAPAVVCTHPALIMPVTQSAVLQALFMAAPPLSREFLAERVEIAAGRLDPVPRKIVDVAISRLRKRLAVYRPPVVITTVRGLGYWMAPESKARWAALLQTFHAQVAGPGAPTTS